MSFFRLLKQWCKRPFVTDAPFSLVRMDDAAVYVREGFGGQPIEQWPVYGFFDLYLKGQQSEAKARYREWYAEQFGKYRHTPKRNGGMQGGSLQMAVDRAGGSGPGALETGIATRVDERFAFLEGIARKGYVPNPTDPVHAVQKEGKIYLKNGHHRAAALKLLGHDTVPHVVAYPRWLGTLLGY